MSDERPAIRENEAGLLLLALVVVAAGVRIAWALTQVGAIENEGSEYCRLAENLLSGNGYRGIVANAGVQLNFPPLYPVLIAALMLPLRNSELAARLVSLVAGTALVWGVFLTCRSLYGRRVAFAGAAIVALHPTLIALSASVYSEALYLTLLTFGLYWLLRTAESGGRIGASVAAGVFFGLAYLTRPEALVLAAPLLVLLVVRGAVVGTGRRMIVAAGSVLLVLLVLAAPYVAFLSVNAGQLRWEGKGTIICAIGQRMSSGLSYREASYGIGEDLREEGIHLRSNRDVLRSGAMRITNPASAFATARYFANSARRNVGRLYPLLSAERAFGAPILSVLVLLGLFRTPWSRGRLAREAAILVLFGSALGVLLIGQELDFRHTLVLLVILILWASKGVDELAQWVEATMGALWSGFARCRPVVVRGLIVVALCGAAAQALGGVGDFTQSGAAQLKAAGLWLKQHDPGPKRIMGTGTVVAYYARGDLWYLPYADSSLALRYVESKAPDFIVLESGNARPFIDSWMNGGIPNREGKLIYAGGTGPRDRVMIYEWLGRRASKDR
jgi:4-amino-4-deoxy-L-arabinose transferase-like glycosyltransferase